MNMFFSKLLKNIFTGKDNDTYDVARILWFFGVLVYMGLSIYAVIRGQAWDPLNFGTGLGGALAGGGAGVAIKEKTEPGERQ